MISSPISLPPARQPTHAAHFSPLNWVQSAVIYCQTESWTTWPFLHRAFVFVRLRIDWAIDASKLQFYRILKFFEVSDKSIFRIFHSRWAQKSFNKIAIGL